MAGYAFLVARHARIMIAETRPHPLLRKPAEMPLMVS